MPRSAPTPTSARTVRECNAEARPAQWRRALWRHRAGVLVTVAALAPVLGTVDLAWLDAVNMNQPPMTKADWTGPDNQTAPRTFVDGYRQLRSRCLQPCVLRHPHRWSWASRWRWWRSSSATFFGLMAGYFRRVDAVLMRVMDGLMAIPHPARHCAGGGVGRAALYRDHRDCGAGDPVSPGWCARWCCRFVKSPTSKLPFPSAPPDVEDSAAARAAELDRADGGAGHVRASAILIEAIRFVPRPRTAERNPHLGQHHGRSARGVLQRPHNMWFPGIFLAFTVLAVNLCSATVCATRSTRSSTNGGRSDERAARYRTFRS